MTLELSSNALRMQERLVTVKTLHNRPSPIYLLDKIIGEHTTGMLYGPPYSYKSFLAMDWAFCLAEGLPWEADGAYPVHQANVVYVVGEGSGGLSKRAYAWESYREHEISERFLWYPEPINLMSMKVVEDFASAIHTHQPGLIVFDTLAKCAVGGDENSARDMGIVTDSMGFLVRELGCSTFVLHHTTKNGEDFRGSSALLGNVDWAAEVKRSDKSIVVRCEKQKDDPHFDSIRLESFSVENSLCLRAKVGETPAGDAGWLLKLVSQMSHSEAVSTAKLKEAIAQEEKNTVSHATFYRLLNALVDEQLVENIGTKKKGLFIVTPKGKAKVSQVSHGVS